MTGRQRVVCWVAFFSSGAFLLWALIEVVVLVAHWLGGAL
jgi:hypothetical protein